MTFFALHFIQTFIKNEAKWASLSREILGGDSDDEKEGGGSDSDTSEDSKAEEESVSTTAC